MTRPERDMLRRAIDQARRGYLAAIPAQRCENCETAIGQNTQGGNRRRFCSPRCRTLAWYRTPAGKASQAASKRKLRAKVAA